VKKKKKKKPAEPTVSAPIMTITEPAAPVKKKAEKSTKQQAAQPSGASGDKKANEEKKTGPIEHPALAQVEPAKRIKNLRKKLREIEVSFINMKCHLLYLSIIITNTLLFNLRSAIY
jgi:hypothetical protein